MTIDLGPKVRLIESTVFMDKKRETVTTEKDFPSFRHLSKILKKNAVDSHITYKLLKNKECFVNYPDRRLTLKIINLED